MGAGGGFGGNGPAFSRVTGGADGIACVLCLQGSQAEPMALLTCYVRKDHRLSQWHCLLVMYARITGRANGNACVLCLQGSQAEPMALLTCYVSKETVKSLDW